MRTPGIGDPHRMLEWIISIVLLLSVSLLFSNEKTSFENNFSCIGSIIISGHLRKSTESKTSQEE